MPKIENKDIFTLSRKIGLLVAPCLFFIILYLPPLPYLGADAQKVIAVAVWMLCWWITEAVQLPITSLLPIILFPLLGVMDIKEATTPYGNPIIFLFMGGFMIALALEKWNLHLRIALNIVKLTGTNANGIVWGFMVSTALLSMWISNTATTVMMLPIAYSVIQLLSNTVAKSEQHQLANFSTTMMLGIAYSASIGGIATLVGTPPNSVMVSMMDATFHYKISFAQWFMIGFPFAVLLLIVNYWVMVKWLYPIKIADFSGSGAIIDQELAKLGKMSIGEKATSWVFCGTALLWIFKDVLNYMLPFLHLDDTVVAIIASVILFVVPLNWKKESFILQWEDTSRLSWGILLLFGGGLSLANALEKVGIIRWIAQSVTDNSSLSLWMLVWVLVVLAVFMTEIMSNVALVTVLVPVVSAITIGLGQNPLMTVIPITIGASCAFMLPMATPPNAIVFSSGYVKVSQMMRVGFVLNILSIIILMILALTLLPYIFDIQEGVVPEWARVKK
jgi:solute carrier family 13 (sodium-dependent dicarboxylate transporter), member 2/3/5